MMKQVANKDAILRINKEGTWIEEGDLSFEVSESDGYALEEALRVREKLVAELVELRDQFSGVHDAQNEKRRPLRSRRTLLAAEARYAETIFWNATGSLIAISASILRLSSMFAPPSLPISFE